MIQRGKALDATLSSLNFPCGHARFLNREVTVLTGNESAQWAALEG